jgi:hypothetical protein
VLSLGLLGTFGLRDAVRQISRRGDWSGFLLAVVLIALGMVGSWLLIRGKRHLAPTAEEVMTADPRPPVIYLRVFRDDSTGAVGHGAYFLPSLSEEEQLARVISRIGPFVAIGRPGDDLPELGAARLYVSDAEWQEQVTELMQKANLVVLRAGDSDGFWWEVERAAKLLRPEQVVFLVPHDPKAYETFRQRAQRHLRKPLPDHPGQGRAGSLRGLIYFERAWLPRFVPFTGALLRTTMRSPLVGRLTYAFRPVFEQLGVPWRPPPLGWYRLYFLAMVVMGIVGLLVIGLLALLGRLS